MCDEPHYVESAYNEEMEQVEREIAGSEGLEMCESYYWIEAENRDDVLKVDNFVEAEELMKEFREGNLDDFEHAEQEYPHTAQIRSTRPPY